MAKTGRPREFDREQALHRAMKLFWQRGYEGATLTDLQKVMGGITAPSFYAAFGSKEELFREAVALYNKIENAPIAKALAEEATARASVEGILRAAVNAFCRPDSPRGCLVVLSAINCMAANKGVEEFMRHQRSSRERAIRQRLRRGLKEGDVPAGTDIDSLASFYISVIDGLSLQARDGASRRALKAIVNCAMAAWNPMTTSHRARA